MRNWVSVVALSVAMPGCGGNGDSVCYIPTYKLPAHRLAPVEARHLSNMCTENYAISWAVRSKESAGDIAEAILDECGDIYYAQAAADWPTEKWGPVVLDRLPRYQEEHRRSAIKYVVRARMDGCKEVSPLPEHQWVTDKPADKKRLKAAQ